MFSAPSLLVRAGESCYAEEHSNLIAYGNNTGVTNTTYYCDPASYRGLPTPDNQRKWFWSFGKCVREGWIPEFACPATQSDNPWTSTKGQCWCYGRGDYNQQYYFETKKECQKCPAGYYRKNCGCFDPDTYDGSITRAVGADRTACKSLNQHDVFNSEESAINFELPESSLYGKACPVSEAGLTTTRCLDFSDKDGSVFALPRPSQFYNSGTGRWDAYDANNEKERNAQYCVPRRTNSMWGLSNTNDFNSNYPYLRVKKSSAVCGNGNPTIFHDCFACDDTKGCFSTVLPQRNRFCSEGYCAPLLGSYFSGDEEIARQTCCSAITDKDSAACTTEINKETCKTALRPIRCPRDTFATDDHKYFCKPCTLAMYNDKDEYIGICPNGYYVDPTLTLPTCCDSTKRSTLDATKQAMCTCILEKTCTDEQKKAQKVCLPCDECTDRTAYANSVDHRCPARNYFRVRTAGGGCEKLQTCEAFWRDTKALSLIDLDKKMGKFSYESSADITAANAGSKCKYAYYSTSFGSEDDFTAFAKMDSGGADYVPMEPKWLTSDHKGEEYVPFKPGYKRRPGHFGQLYESTTGNAGVVARDILAAYIRCSDKELKDFDFLLPPNSVKLQTDVGSLNSSVRFYYDFKQGWGDDCKQLFSATCNRETQVEVRRATAVLNNTADYTNYKSYAAANGLEPAEQNALVVYYTSLCLTCPTHSAPHVTDRTQCVCSDGYAPADKLYNLIVANGGVEPVLGSSKDILDFIGLSGDTYWKSAYCISCNGGFRKGENNLAEKYMFSCTYDNVTNHGYDIKLCSDGEVLQDNKCTTCPAGQKPLSSSSAACQICLPGFYADNAAKTCSKCPTGKFSAVAGATACTDKKTICGSDSSGRQQMLTVSGDAYSDSTCSECQLCNASYVALYKEGRNEKNTCSGTDSTVGHVCVSNNLINGHGKGKRLRYKQPSTASTSLENIASENTLSSYLESCDESKLPLDAEFVDHYTDAAGMQSECFFACSYALGTEAAAYKDALKSDLVKGYHATTGSIPNDDLYRPTYATHLSGSDYGAVKTDTSSWVVFKQFVSSEFLTIQSNNVAKTHVFPFVDAHLDSYGLTRKNRICASRSGLQSNATCTAASWQSPRLWTLARGAEEAAYLNCSYLAVTHGVYKVQLDLRSFNVAVFLPDGKSKYRVACILRDDSTWEIVCDKSLVDAFKTQVQTLSTNALIATDRNKLSFMATLVKPSFWRDVMQISYGGSSDSYFNPFLNISGVSSSSGTLTVNRCYIPRSDYPLLKLPYTSDANPTAKFSACAPCHSDISGLFNRDNDICETFFGTSSSYFVDSSCSATSSSDSFADSSCTTCTPISGATIIPKTSPLWKPFEDAFIAKKIQASSFKCRFQCLSGQYTNFLSDRVAYEQAPCKQCADVTSVCTKVQFREPTQTCSNLSPFEDFNPNAECVSCQDTVRSKIAKTGAQFLLAAERPLADVRTTTGVDSCLVICDERQKKHTITYSGAVAHDPVPYSNFSACEDCDIRPNELCDGKCSQDGYYYSAASARCVPCSNATCPVGQFRDACVGMRYTDAPCIQCQASSMLSNPSINNFNEPGLAQYFAGRKYDISEYATFKQRLVEAVVRYSGTESNAKRFRAPPPPSTPLLDRRAILGTYGVLLSEDRKCAVSCANNYVLIDIRSGEHPLDDVDDHILSAEAGSSYYLCLPCNHAVLLGSFDTTSIAAADHAFYSVFNKNYENNPQYAFPISRWPYNARLLQFAPILRMSSQSAKIRGACYICSSGSDVEDADTDLCVLKAGVGTMQLDPDNVPQYLLSSTSSTSAATAEAVIAVFGSAPPIINTNTISYYCCYFLKSNVLMRKCMNAGTMAAIESSLVKYSTSVIDKQCGNTTNITLLQSQFAANWTQLQRRRRLFSSGGSGGYDDAAAALAAEVNLTAIANAALLTFKPRSSSSTASTTLSLLLSSLGGSGGSGGGGSGIPVHHSNNRHTRMLLSDSGGSGSGSAATLVQATGACFTGTYKPSRGSGPCVPCPDHSSTASPWNGVVSAAACLCLPGYRAVRDANTGSLLTCIACASGFFSTNLEQNGTEQCYPCPAGENTANTAASASCMCAQGYYRGGVDDTCVPCEPGYYCTDESRYPCPPRSHSLPVSHSRGGCACDDGFYGYLAIPSQQCKPLSIGVATCVPGEGVLHDCQCKQGWVLQSVGGSSSLMSCVLDRQLCAPGHFVLLPDVQQASEQGLSLQLSSLTAADCRPCPKNTYASEPAFSQCTPCPDGMQTPGNASVSKAECLCPRGAQQQQTPPQQISNSSGGINTDNNNTTIVLKNTCIACASENGEVYDLISMSCRKCPGGTLPLGGICLCPPGNYFRDETKMCTPCPLNYYSQFNSFSCAPCPAGLVTTDVGGTRCTCPGGFFPIGGKCPAKISAAT